jgi:hypothetical protein
MNQPLASIIITVYTGEHYIQETISNVMLKF